MNKIKPTLKQRQRILEQSFPDNTIRWLDVAPAYDLVAEGYGIHGLEFVFGIKRGKIGVTWTLMTSFFLPHTRKRLDAQHLRTYLDDGLGDVSYHSPVQLHEFQHAIADCQVTGGDCFVDGSSLESQTLFNNLVSDGEVWKELLRWLESTEKRITEQEMMKRNFS